MKIRAWTQAIRDRDSDTCQKCGKKRKFQGRQFDSHHIIPLKEGGRNTLENGMLLCPQCHKHKHSFLQTGELNCKCLKCDYEWASAVEKPKACPKCRGRTKIRPVYIDGVQRFKCTFRFPNGKICAYMWEGRVKEGEVPKACPECKSRGHIKLHKKVK